MCLQEKKVVRFSRSLILHFLEFTREEYCSGLPFPSSRILLTQGSNLPLLHCDMWSVSHWALWEAHFLFIYPFINAKSWASLKLNIQKTEIMASGPITSWQIDGETVETVSDFNFGGSKITADGDCSHKIKRRLLLGRKVMTNLNSILKKQRHYFANKRPSGQGYGFSSGHVWMWELDCKERWAPKNWCFFFFIYFY